MNVLVGIITALSIPLLVLNMLGGLVAGIWLAILGEWGNIITGILFLIFSHWFLALILMPSLLLAAPAALFAEKGKTFGAACFGTLGAIYTLSIFALWCCGILFLYVYGASASNLIPKLLWSYGVATAPLAYMGSKDVDSRGDGGASAVTMFFAELGYATIMITAIFNPITLLGAYKVFAGFLAAALVVQITTFVALIHSKRETNSI